MKMKCLLLIVLMVVSTTACATPPPLLMPPTVLADDAAVATCDLLPQVREIPFRDDAPSYDAIYSLLSRDRDRIKSCLIEAVVDTTEIPDPTPSPKVDGFAVGDLAFILLGYFYGVPFAESLPAGVAAELPDRGVYAYYDWIRRSGSREQLRDNIREWFQQEEAR